MRNRGSERRSNARISARRLGRFGEWRARWFYRLRGYRIVARNLKIRGGEIDLIVRRGAAMAIVEVKTRQSLMAGQGFAAVDREKQLQLVKLTDAYLARLPRKEIPQSIRYDVLSLHWTGWRFAILHFPDAFRPVGDARYPWKWTI